MSLWLAPSSVLSVRLSQGGHVCPVRAPLHRVGERKSRASQCLGSWRHHSGAEFYGFSCIPLIFTQSLRLEIYLPFLSHSITTPVFPTFSQFSLGSLGPKPATRMPVPRRARLPSASHTAYTQCSFPKRTEKGRWWLQCKDLALLLLLLMTLLHPDSAGCTLPFHLCPGNCPLETHPHVTCSPSAECC